MLSFSWEEMLSDGDTNASGLLPSDGSGGADTGTETHK